eukprot:s4530_g4.t1
MSELAAPGAATPTLRRLRALDSKSFSNVEQPGSRKTALEPQVGDRIMVVRQPGLDGILDGSKTSRLGYVWLGADGYIHGRAKIVEAVTLTAEALRAREAEHRWPADATVPYKVPRGLVLAEAERLPTPMSYWRPEIASGWNVYRKEAGDLPMRGKKKRRKQPDSSDADGPEPVANADPPAADAAANDDCDGLPQPDLAGPAGPNAPGVQINARHLDQYQQHVSH